MVISARASTTRSSRSTFRPDRQTSHNKHRDDLGCALSLLLRSRALFYCTTSCSSRTSRRSLHPTMEAVHGSRHNAEGVHVPATRPSVCSVCTVASLPCARPSPADPNRDGHRLIAARPSLNAFPRFLPSFEPSTFDFRRSGCRCKCCRIADGPFQRDCSS